MSTKPWPVRSWRALALAAAVALAGCSSSDDPDSVFLEGVQYLGGVWRGTDASGATLYGLSTEDGDFRLASSVGLQYFGNYAVGGNLIAGSFAAVSNFNGPEICPGSTDAIGEILSGRLSRRSSLSGDTVLRTECGTFIQSSFTLDYDSLYERNSGPLQASGTYSDTATGSVVSVSVAGTLFGQDPVSGCVLSGTIESVNTRFNVYNISLTYESCVGATASLNDLSFAGFATLDNRSSAAAEQLIAIVASAGSAGGVGLVLVLDRI